MHSIDTRLPDAVFTFRAGDPQYEHWQRQYREQEESAQPAGR